MSASVKIWFIISSPSFASFTLAVFRFSRMGLENIKLLETEYIEAPFSRLLDLSFLLCQSDLSKDLDLYVSSYLEVDRLLRLLAKFLASYFSKTSSRTFCFRLFNSCIWGLVA